MRFKEGTKVEVLSKTEVPSGSWLCAEIICGNGHYYTIRYDGYRSASGEAIVERISRKAIRPCPTAFEVTEKWSPGDVVEVYQKFSWKMATVLKVLGEKHILVRLLGSSLEFQVNKFDIRVRQAWQDDKWFVVGKGSSRCENGKRDYPLVTRQNLFFNPLQKIAAKSKLSINNDCHPEKKELCFLEFHPVSSKTLKRGRSSQVEAYAEPSPKFRAIENEGRYPRANLVEEFIAPLNSRKTGISDMAIERRKQTGAIGCSAGENLESDDDDDSITCSVGSCSMASSNSYKLHYSVYAGPFEDVDSPLSDAESVYHREYEEGNCSPPTQEELAAEIHRLELHAYRCTIEALHASGPLSWEQEELITNLRLSLHISNDEHLMELRNLISSENSIPVR